tara:strand:- start:4505 stop:5278 length:774 start_codon:yes stop_codon:yes gene_type:complete
MDQIITQNKFYYYALISWIGLAIVTFIVLLLFKPSTYGRHTNIHRLSISNNFGWFLMELPTVLLMPYFLFKDLEENNIVILCFFVLYMIHYSNRVFIFPLKIRTQGKKIPVLIVLSAILFNICNTYFIGYYFSQATSLYNFDWFFSPYFIIGLLVFLTGAYINHQSDTILINLRKMSENGYKIPYGGFFRYISCPNHFGEIIEWIGFAILTWSWPTFVFAFWTIANLLPRSIQHHHWYKQQFANYPKNRKAILPYLL